MKPTISPIKAKAIKLELIDYVNDLSVSSKFRNILLSLTDKTTLMVTSVTHKVIADKLCEKFNINCTVKVAEGGITGKRANLVVVDECKTMPTIHFERFMGQFSQASDNLKDR